MQQRLEGFGFITTNSISQNSNRRCLDQFIGKENQSISLAYVIPDHPWVDSHGAAVRVALAAVTAGSTDGILATARREEDENEGEILVSFAEDFGRIGSDLKIGSSASGSVQLKANEDLSFRGVSFVGKGFVIDETSARKIGYSQIPDPPNHLREIRTGNDLTKRPRRLLALDFFSLTEDELREQNPSAYQWLLTESKPERDPRAHSSDGAQYAKKWWVFGKPRPEFRKASRNLQTYLATPMSAKHRIFVFLPIDILSDQGVITFGVDDRYFLGVLSSAIHVKWSLSDGGRLGKGNDPRYNNTRCFETFPFPAPSPELETQIRELGERLDAHRKRQQAAHPDLTMTGMSNVLEKLRKVAGASRLPAEPEKKPDEERRDAPTTVLTDKERVIHDDGLVSVLKQIHDELDAAVLAAYGWEDLAAGDPRPIADRLACGNDTLEEAILERLVALNHERAEEEKNGKVRWLRPEFQNPQGESEEPSATQAELPGTRAKKIAKKKAAAVKKQPLPKTLPDQITAVRDVLAAAPEPIAAAAIAKRFTRANRDRLAEVLETLTALGHAIEADGCFLSQ